MSPPAPHARPGFGGGGAAGVIGVVGAGTMGTGIAALACRAGARTLLYDPEAKALGEGVRRTHAHLERMAARERRSDEQARAANALLETTGDVSDLGDCELIIEAAPERLELKHELYARLSEVVGPECVLATNTSSLPVTAIAAGARDAARVVGMHFFNPAPVMRLLEVVAGEQSSSRALDVARATGEAMGKTVIQAADGPGFLVNRCNRPFGLEALGLLGERVAQVDEIDRICRLGGGFRMGPFELMDLVGVDVGLEVSRSFYEQSFGEPRWRPSPITSRYVAAGRFGRKAGRGYYDYTSGEHRPPDPPPPPVGGGAGTIVVRGISTLATELRDLAVAAGWEVRPADGDLRRPVELFVDCDAKWGGEPSQRDPRAVLCDRGSLSDIDVDGGAAGFMTLAPLRASQLVELTRTAATSASSAERVERLFTTLGKHVQWVRDAPGLVLGRIVAQVVNECAFALGEEVGSAQDIDTGMVLGLNYPRGPLAWADAIGIEQINAILRGLSRQLESDRYRVAPSLQALENLGRLGGRAQSAFFEHSR